MRCHCYCRGGTCNSVTPAVEKSKTMGPSSDARGQLRVHLLCSYISPESEFGDFRRKKTICRQQAKIKEHSNKTDAAMRKSIKLRARDSPSNSEEYLTTCAKLTFQLGADPRFPPPPCPGSSVPFSQAVEPVASHRFESQPRSPLVSPY